jgi:hypothetical protein
MQDIKNNKRVKRIILINPFIDNYGTIQKDKLLFTILFLSIFYFNSMVLLNALLEIEIIDYYQITSYIQKVNITMFQYLAENTLNGLNVINSFEWINKYLPYAIFKNNMVNFPPSNIQLHYNLYLMAIVSIILTIFHNSLYVYQIQTQNILSSCDMKT